MDAMDVLGALLGKKSGSGSAGGNILKDILGGGRPKPQPQPQREHPRARQRPRTIGEASKSLEELLGVSHQHHQQRRAPQRQTVPASEPQRGGQPQRRGTPSGWAPEQEAMNEQAQVLVRAMVNAAKSDGQITRDEQDSILKQLDHVTQEEVDFLRAEFSKPVDVRDFTWSVPRGLEEQVYTVSLIAIDLDEQKEAEYLADLAHGLRLDTDRCNQIHRNYGAPAIFKS